MVVKVFIRDPRGERFEIDLCDTEEQFQNITVLDLKRRIAEREGIQVPEAIRLVFNGRDLDNDGRRLSDYGVKDKSDLQICFPPGPYVPPCVTL